MSRHRSLSPHEPARSRMAMIDIGRRKIVTALGGVAAAWPVAAYSQSERAGDAAPELARVRTARRILLKGGVILTVDPQIGDFASGDILIEDGKIRDVRPDIAVSDTATAVIDASRTIVIPGFVDTHSHSYQGL